MTNNLDILATALYAKTCDLPKAPPATTDWESITQAGVR